MLQRGAPKLGKDGKPMKDKHGKVIYEPYRIKVLNTINFKKSMHYNPFAYTGASTAFTICEPVSCIAAPAFAMLPKVWLAASSLETFAPTLDATPAIGPERLSIMFIMSDSLNTDSKLIFCFHLQFEIEAENDRRREAVTRGTLARSPG